MCYNMHTGYTHTSHPKIQRKRDQLQNRLGQEVLYTCKVLKQKLACVAGVSSRLKFFGKGWNESPETHMEMLATKGINERLRQLYFYP